VRAGRQRRLFPFAENLAPSRLRDTTGWQPQIPLDDTLRDVIAALLA